jgi:hypothetical protein
MDLAYLSGQVDALHLVRNEDEQHLTYSAMTQRFANAREAAIAEALEQGQQALAASLKEFQFRGLRAKAGSDLPSLKDAKDLLGHESGNMTEHYGRARVGAPRFGR